VNKFGTIIKIKFPKFRNKKCKYLVFKEGKYLKISFKKILLQNRKLEKTIVDLTINDPKHLDKTLFTFFKNFKAIRFF